MSEPYDVIQSVAFTESLRNISAELNANASLTDRPLVGELGRIAPEQIAHDAGVRRLSESIDLANVVQRDVLLRQAAVHDQHALVQAAAERQRIEHVRDEVVHQPRVFRLNLALETVDLVHRVTLVVTASHVEVVRIEHLEAEQREDAFDRERASVGGQRSKLEN